MDTSSTPDSPEIRTTSLDEGGLIPLRLLKQEIKEDGNSGDTHVEALTELLSSDEIKEVMESTRLKIEVWIVNNLTPSTIIEILNVYEEIIAEVIKSKRHFAFSSATPIPNFEDKVVSGIKNEMRPVITAIVNDLIIFRDEMENIFQDKPFLSWSEMYSTIKRKLLKIPSTSNNPAFEEIRFMARSKLGGQYEDHNFKVTVNYNITALHCRDVAEKYYKNEMNLMRQSCPLSPAILETFHKQVLENIEKVWISTFKPCDQEEMKKWLLQLRQSLQNILKELLAEYLLGLEKRVSTTQNLVTNWLQKFEEKMGDKSLSKLEPSDGTVKQILRQSFSDTKISLKDLVNMLDPDSFPLSCLQSHVNEILKRSGQDMTSPSFSSSRPTTIQEILQETQEELPPLIIQFDKRSIWISIEIEDDKHHYPYGQRFIPGKIGITEANTWVVGPTLEQKSSIQCIWSFENCMISEDGGKWSEEILISGEIVEITFEFLFGAFLSLVKKEVEDKLKGKLWYVLISVPMWLPSIHKKQLLVSGEVAGFLNTHLVYENAAIIKSTLSTLPLNFKFNFSSMVIISENSGTVELAMHFVDQGNTSKVKVHLQDFSSQYDHFRTISSLQSLWAKMAIQMGVLWEAFQGAKTIFYVSWRSPNFKDILYTFLNTIAPHACHQYFPPEMLQDLLSSEIMWSFKNKEISKLKYTYFHNRFAKADPQPFPDSTKFEGIVLSDAITLEASDFVFSIPKIPISSKAHQVFKFYEKAPDIARLLGELTITNESKQDGFIMPKFLYSNFVFSLISVDIATKEDGGTKGGDTRTLSVRNYRWKSSQLGIVEIEGLKGIVSHLNAIQQPED